MTHLQPVETAKVMRGPLLSRVVERLWLPFPALSCSLMKPSSCHIESSLVERLMSQGTKGRPFPAGAAQELSPWRKGPAKKP